MQGRGKVVGAGGLDTLGREIPVRNVYINAACFILRKCVSLLNVLFLNSYYVGCLAVTDF